MFITVRSRITMSCARPITPRMSQRRSRALSVEVASDMRFTTFSLLLRVWQAMLRAAAAMGLLLLQEPVGEDDLDDRLDGVLARPVALQLDRERDPADRLAAGLDHAVQSGAVGLG